MTVERGVRIMAGVFTLVTVGLGMPGSPLFVNEKFLWLTVFEGVNQIQAGITGFCLADVILKRLGMSASSAPPA
jgi:Protein of unknown function (DUF2892)